MFRSQMVATAMSRSQDVRDLVFRDVDTTLIVPWSCPALSIAMVMSHSQHVRDLVFRAALDDVDSATAISRSQRHVRDLDFQVA
ncbi:hypothetical protein AZE42_03434 [Rhizopogon vesiculosus]|uniref:Uncharacterized protein n=1 Tax=Rhizopogon vesiculosus TaxID=180088 RepID=A0A1J8QRQ9_9AGAM|nr:hypothetical protein AZE42_03434 [Rhizopogon vesiculosus]